MNYTAHPTAIIDDGAKIGSGTRVWHWVHICGRNVSIGENCSFGQNCYVGNDVKIGANVKVQNNVSIYDQVELEDDVFCGPSMVFTNVVNPRSAIPRKDEYKKTLVRRGATLGANCTVVCGHEIGPYSFIAAGAVVTRDIPAYALMAGVPARQLGWMCECGVRLHAPVDGHENPASAQGHATQPSSRGEPRHAMQPPAQGEPRHAKQSRGEQAHNKSQLSQNQMMPAHQVECEVCNRKYQIQGFCCEKI